MQQWISVDDLFVVGIAFDLIGGYLLARGLIASPAAIARRTDQSAARSTDMNAHEASAQVHDRANAEVGLSTLGLGFLLQAAGYLLLISGVALHTGGQRVVGSVALAVIVAVILQLGLRQVRMRRVRKLMVKVARHDSTSGKRLDVPDGPTLLALGETIGLELDRHPGEAWRDAMNRYARESFGVRGSVRTIGKPRERTFEDELTSALVGI